MNSDERDPSPPTRPGEAHQELFQVEPGVHEPLADLAAAAGARIEESIHAEAPPRRRWTAYLFLGIAIVAGVTGTAALSASAGFTLLVPTVVLVLAYLACFLALTRALRVIPISIVYATWSGVGIALITLIGWRLFGQRLAAGEIAGIVLILAGVVVIHLFSNARAH